MNNPSILHVLNGDSTKNKFDNSGIAGDVIVWREVLVQGPLFYQVDSELFWDMRSQFIEKAFDSNLHEYRKKVILEFQKLNKFEGSEIVLWFEYDVFCQINMIALLSHLLRKKAVTISLVCVGDYPGFEKKVGLGEIPTADYPDLFAKRQKLEKTDLVLADKAWMYYCGKEFSKFSQIKSKKLSYLSDALNASLDLFRKDQELSIHEIEILKLIATNQFTRNKLVGHLLANDSIFGFGDLQYFHLIDGLEKYFIIKQEILAINGLGREMI